jgi:hypothetical protein
MKSVWKYIAGVFLAIVIIVAFFFSPLEQIVALKLNRAKWERQSISHYRYNLTSHSGPHNWYPDFTEIIEVKNGHIVSATDVNGQIISVPPEYDWDSVFYTMEDLFDMVDDVQKTASKVTVKYDAAYGFPTFIFTKEGVTNAVSNNETTYYVSNFEILP